MKFDEINTLSSLERVIENRAEKRVKKSENRSIPYEEYFGIMKISDKQKKDRIKFAELLEDDLIMLMTLYGVSREYNVKDDSFIVEEVRKAYLKATASFNVPSDAYILDLAYAFAVGFVSTTKEHFDDEWYTSNDRARFNAENEANTVLNYKEYLDAKNKFRYKIWHTENDNRVRFTHVPLEGEKIPIDDLFIVGEALMRYPKDIEYAADYPDEYINCRCSMTYSN